MRVRLELLGAIRLKLGILVEKPRVNGGSYNKRAVQTLRDSMRIPVADKGHKNPPAG